MSNSSKGKEIELKNCPFCGEEDAVVDNGESIVCLFCLGKCGNPNKTQFDVANRFEAWSTRQSPQINIDELTGVIEREITRFVPNAKDKFANLIAQAIASHLNGKGDGDE